MDYKLVLMFCLFGVMSGFTAMPIAHSSNQQKILEGDILVTSPLRELMSIKHRTKREITSKIIKRWPNNIVPYVIDSTLGKLARRAIRRAINQFHYHTCVEFVRRTSEVDYVAFQRGIGCYSPIGRQGGRQKLSVGDGCEQRGTIMHELMHALGFFHEHSRYDRDKYVKILWWNIEPDFLRNFESYSHDDLDTLDIPYDYDSLMHYDNQAFSRNRQNTIEAIDNANRQLGQMKGFSEQDIKQLLKAYKCKSIDKDPLPAQPLKTTDKYEEEDDRPLIQTTKIDEEKQSENRFTKLTGKEQRDTGILIVRPTKASIRDTEHRYKGKTAVKASKETQKHENVTDSATSPKGECRDMYPVACMKFASAKGYCQYWRSFMLKRCPHACGFCQSQKVKEKKIWVREEAEKIIKT